jgi:hypothetical protein
VTQTLLCDSLMANTAGFSAILTTKQISLPSGDQGVERKWNWQDAIATFRIMSVRPDSEGTNGDPTHRRTDEDRRIASGPE